MATRPYRNDDPFLVVRSLQSATAPSTPTSKTGVGLFVQSAPGGLQGQYDFDTECKVLDNHLGAGIKMKTVEKSDDRSVEERSQKPVP